MTKREIKRNWNCFKVYKPKCDKYWPDQIGESCSFGEMTVTLTNQLNEPNFTIRQMIIESVGTMISLFLVIFLFEIVLFNMWSTRTGRRETVRETLPLLALAGQNVSTTGGNLPVHGSYTLQPQYRWQSRSHGRSLQVFYTFYFDTFWKQIDCVDLNSPYFNCIIKSAGTGRTGTYLAIEPLAEQIRNKKKINIAERIIEMRKSRTNMVQNSVTKISSSIAT